MVFVLKSRNGNNHYVIRGQQYTVGRKDNDILLKDDQSISRKHATIKIDDQFIVLIDHGSKYGTFLNGEKVTPNEETHVRNSDKLRFGVFQNEFSIERIQLVTVCSGLTSDQREEVAKIMKLLGGTVVKHWNGTCTHLTNQEIALTVKVLEAIIDEKPLVNIEYWREFLKNVKQSKPPPNVKDFQPSITEMFLSETKMEGNSARKSLFKNKIFVFPNETLKRKVFGIVLKCGGSCISWEENSQSLSQIATNSKEYIFVHSNNIADHPASLKQVFNSLRERGQRTIPYSEIATAIINCSCEKDCNPNFDKLAKVFVKKQVQVEDVERPLVFDTETQNEDLVKEEIVIPTSFVEDNINEEEATLLPPPSLPSRSTTTPFAVITHSMKRSNDQSDEEVQSGLKKIKLNESVTKTNSPFFVKTQTETVKNKNRPSSIQVSMKREAQESSNESLPVEKRMKVNPFVVNRKTVSGQKNVFKKETVCAPPVESNIESEWFKADDVKVETRSDEDDEQLSSYRISKENILNTVHVRPASLRTPSRTQPNTNQKNFKRFVKVESRKYGRNILDFTSASLNLTLDGVEKSYVL